ncbi:MAG: bifunctional phosphoribosylaminoimidazolecarboxamide formyltransferase/IMP cyclohydrolase [Cellulomonadaceae bacterium]|jgi:phosphoribosylaminoimidazolecarboxamide formyltransferase/IMP cyclohydrolase|nr:bifunctional phosphoribosylaminoimidazolecarboxamide formyltransferase/IMP cyclohydrolase [Cellulomonadaceae bacterium]
MGELKVETAAPDRPTVDKREIKRALISVFDKTGLLELVTSLHNAGVEIVSTGSTAKAIQNANIPVTLVEQVTGSPEILEGRVKTLHPAIHGGLLADTRKDSHLEQLAEFGYQPFDLVIGNLYPFSQLVKTDLSENEMIEQIDIGGPALLRASAKNHASVAAVISPDQYPYVIAALNDGGFTYQQRRSLAAKVFETISKYDNDVTRWLDPSDTQGELGAPGAQSQQVELRYGENPHQKASIIPDGTGVGLANAKVLQGKPMSYNNYVDADAAWRAAWDQTEPAVAIIKHANPCGIAIAATIAEAYQRAFATDPLSAYGSVVAANRLVTKEMAEQVAKVFTEVLVAPGFEPDALEVLQAKRNLRVLQAEALGLSGTEVEERRISGGLLIQDVDRYQAEGDDPANWTQVAGPKVDPATPQGQALLADLEFAWRAVRSAKSNAILLARDGAAIGIGMGQVNRVDSCRLALARAAEFCGGSQGSVAASDAFFPFADGLQLLLDGGIAGVVQPGGSVRDADSIAAAEAAGVPMFLTGVRHFYH